MLTGSFARRVLPAGLLAGSLLLPAGCKKMTTPETATSAPAPTDQQIANDVQGRINGEQALNGQNIQVNVNGGTVTLDGSVNNDAARALAAADSGAVTGVKTVINNLTVAPAAAKTEQPPKPEARRKDHREKAEQAKNEPPPPAAEPAAAPAPPPQPAAPPPPPKPVVQTVTITSGTSLPVRLTDALSSQTAQAGQTIRGVLASDIIVNNMIAIPRGTPVTGTVVQAKDAAHFSGSSLLSLSLTSVQLNGQPVQVSTTPFTQEGKGRGKNTAVKTGGGAALGAIIGALAGGGKGAAIGAASGGGLGAGVNAVTRGEQVKIPAETLINFKLQAPVSVQTSKQAGGANVPTYNDDSPQQ